MELDDVGVFDLHQVLKHLLDLVLKTHEAEAVHILTLCNRPNGGLFQ